MTVQPTSWLSPPKVIVALVLAFLIGCWWRIGLLEKALVLRDVVGVDVDKLDTAADRFWFVVGSPLAFLALGVALLGLASFLRRAVSK